MAEWFAAIAHKVGMRWAGPIGRFARKGAANMQIWPLA